MGNDIGSGLSFKAVCFDFRSTNVGSSVIGTRSTNGFDVITLLSPTLVNTIPICFSCQTINGGDCCLEKTQLM